jgi:hypothetical protein
MGLLHDAIEVLDAGAVAVPATVVLSRDPQPVAFARRGDHGTVMFLLQRTTGDVMAIIALLERRDGTWDEVALVHKPWWDPAEAFENDDLMLTGGHSRFVTDGDANLVLVPGQAAPGTSVARADGDDIAVHSPWGHFVYLGELAAAGERVTLTARRPGVEQTAVFEPIGPR